MDTEIIILLASVVISITVTLLTAFFYLGGYKEKINHLENDNKEIKKDLQWCRDKVVSCETSLKEREPLTRRESPITLTERGTTFLEESKGKEFIDKNYPKLKLLVYDFGTKTSYDIQEKSKEVLRNESEKDNFNQLKEYLFKDGAELNELILVMGIYLRDKILIEN